VHTELKDVKRHNKPFTVHAGAGAGVNITACAGTSHIFERRNFCNDACCQTEWNYVRRVFWPASSYITKVWHWVGVPSISPLMIRDEHGSGLGRTGSGLKPISAGSGLDRTGFFLQMC